MCGDARYVDSKGKEWKVYFPNPKAGLPVVRDGGVEWVKWGRRKEVAAPYFVQGGWARCDSIRAGKWSRCNLEVVQLVVTAFMEKDADRVSHWIDVPEGMAIEGLIVRQEAEVRLYVVTEILLQGTLGSMIGGRVSQGALGTIQFNLLSNTANIYE